MPERVIPPCKADMRDEARLRRSSLTPDEIAEKSAAICTSLLRVIDGIDPVMVYVSKPFEVDTFRCIEMLLSLKKRVIVPIIERETKTLRLSYLGRTSDLIESTFRVPEPVGSEQPVHPYEVKAVIVPMLAFDRRGHRLGYGAGYYDRFLSAQSHLLKIGLAFSCLEVNEIPAEINDIGMDMIVTDAEIIRCRQDPKDS
jgi:5-formyltetrahydrofolate cyclo-ligase